MTKANKKFLKLGTILLLAAILAVTGWRLLGAKTADQPVTQALFNVQRGNLVVTVTESGSIRAAENLTVRCEVDRGATITDIVPEGTILTQEDVENGLVLVRLDSSELEETLNRQEIDFATAEASLTEARESYDIQVKQNESDIAASELGVQFALMDLEKYLGADLAIEMLKIAANLDPNELARTGWIGDPNELGGQSLQTWRQLSADIELTEERLARAAENYTWTQRLYEREFVAKTELDADRLAWRQQQIAKEQAETARDLFLRFDLPKQIATFLSDYREALRELDRTRAQARSRIAQRQASLNSAQSRYDLQKEEMDRLKEQIAACVVRATKPGLVIYSSTQDSYRDRDEIIEIGAEVREGRDILTIPDLSEMIVEIAVHESSVHQVKPGLPAWITVDAFPDRQFRGLVKRVAPLPDAQRGWLNPDTKVYSTQVAITEKDPVLQPGRSAKVKILVQQCRDELYVPLQAIANRKNGQVCYVLAGGRLEEREILTGPFNESFIVVEEGLQPGDVVSLTPPRLDSESQIMLAGGEPEIPEDHQETTPQPEPAQPALAMQNEPDGESPQNDQAGPNPKLMALFRDPQAMQELRQAAQDGALAEKLKEKGIDLDDEMVEQMQQRFRQGPPAPGQMRPPGQAQPGQPPQGRGPGMGRGTGRGPGGSGGPRPVRP